MAITCALIAAVAAVITAMIQTGLVRPDSRTASTLTDAPQTVESTPHPDSPAPSPPMQPETAPQVDLPVQDSDDSALPAPPVLSVTPEQVGLYQPWAIVGSGFPADTQIHVFDDPYNLSLWVDTDSTGDLRVVEGLTAHLDYCEEEPVNLYAEVDGEIVAETMTPVCVD
ncbi:hypothetical protein [Blastococcus sp. DSM 46786]|uniref:hypothetical protein n=1 Tax=Blastococcus sp. DSM 46786 TaxID=1798227 RepID=UPI0011133D8D|nr:hypothetical protein [Blastococcus sp. DSM 46786]